MNSGLETSEDYLQLWHSYLDYLRRTLNFDSLNDEERDSKIEEMRDIFQKAINQMFDCKF
jgi:hypothetical protein